MAKYNTFVVQETKGGKAVMVTSSARKVKRMLTPGLRIEVWSENQKTETVYMKTSERLDKYIAAERDHIRSKQEAAERRNKARRAKAYDRTTRQDAGCRPW
jgi:hypothetical protein